MLNFYLIENVSQKMYSRLRVTWSRLKVSRRLLDIGGCRSFIIVDRLIVDIVNILNRSGAF